MVQILPPNVNIGTQIGQALGGGLQQGMQQGIQRGLLQQALGKVKEISQQSQDPNAPKQDPLATTLALMEAGAGIPGSERYLSTLLPLLMQQGMAGQLPNLGGQGQVPAIPQAGGAEAPLVEGQAVQPQGMPQQNVKQQQQDREVSGLPMSNFIPLNVGELITPEQTAEAVKKTLASGGDPNLIKSYINDYNQGKIDFNELMNKNVDKSFVQNQRRRQLEQGATEFLQKQLPNVEEPFRNIAYGMLSRELNNKPYEDLTNAWQKVSPEFANFQKEYRQFVSAIPQGDALGMNQRTQEALQRRAKSMLEKDPLAYNVLEQSFKDKGQSIVTAAQVLNQLPENVKSIVSGVKDYRNQLFPKFGTMSEQAQLNNIENAEKEQKSMLPSIVDKLAKNWSPNLSLINIYADMKKRGWGNDVLSRMFKSLENFVDFSPQQNAEATQLVSPPKMPVNFLLQ